MAQHEIVHLIDDLDGGAADVTVTFGLDGRNYEIDLSDSHATALRDQLSHYIAAARRATPPTVRRPASPTDLERPRSRAEARAIRMWARSTGHEVASHGRLPIPVVRAYRAAYTSDGATHDPAPASPPPDVDLNTTPTGQPDPGEPVTAVTAEDAGDAAVLAWHEAKNYKIPADRTVTGLMRHRYRTAHKTTDI